MLEMTLKEFEDINLYSNKSMERIISSIINESSNAALVNMFEDSVILLDHENGSFYTADYTFEAETLTLKLENFEEINLSKEEDNFKNKVKNFFEDETVSVNELSEAYKEDVIGQESFLNELINEALSVKDFDSIVDYSQLSEANEDISIKNEDFFKEYVERLETHPLNEIKYINFESPVVVSLLESEKIKLINSTVVEKAAALWKNKKFKEAFVKASTTFVENVEEGKEELQTLFEEYPQIFFLDNADRNALFGKMIIGSDLRESLKDLQKGMNILFEDEDINSIRDTYLSEIEGDEEEEASETPEEEEAEKKEKEEKPAKELTPEQIKKISEELKKVSEKIEDEKLKEKMDELIGKLDGSLEEGTRPDLIKEAIYLLSL